MHHIAGASGIGAAPCFHYGAPDGFTNVTDQQRPLNRVKYFFGVHND